jgi:pSer/pThr/pTyr-binding forkhead associated (FHA) protein
MFENSKNYMVIESVTSTTSKTIHVVNFDASPIIKVGRAQVAEVRITDISVSRHHSTFKLNWDGSVTLNDNYSKFGTLLLLNKPLVIMPSKEGTYI